MEKKTVIYYAIFECKDSKNNVVSEHHRLSKKIFNIFEQDKIKPYFNSWLKSEEEKIKIATKSGNIHLGENNII